MIKLTETDIKHQCIDLLNILHIFSYPLLQGLGSYPGLPDRVMHICHNIAYLEFKRPGKKLSDKQRDFRDQCRTDDISFWIITSVENLITLLERYYGIEVKLLGREDI